MTISMILCLLFQNYFYSTRVSLSRYEFTKFYFHFSLTPELLSICDHHAPVYLLKTSHWWWSVYCSSKYLFPRPDAEHTCFLKREQTLKLYGKSMDIQSNFTVAVKCTCISIEIKFTRDCLISSLGGISTARRSSEFICGGFMSVCRLSSVSLMSTSIGTAKSDRSSMKGSGSKNVSITFTEFSESELKTSLCSTQKNQGDNLLKQSF